MHLHLVMETMKKILAVFLFAGLLIAGVNFGVQGKNNSKDGERVLLSLSPKNSSTESKPAAKEVQVPGIPQILSIPKINVKASVESVGLDSQKRMDVPKSSDNVAWYNLGPKPGTPGSSVIAGHKDESDGSPSVFWDIQKLDIGDKIMTVDSKGKEYTFSVIDKKEYLDASFPLQKVFAGDGSPMLNLITCGGVWDGKARNYSHRIVIYSKLE